jgi:hypothetical protein
VAAEVQRIDSATLPGKTSRDLSPAITCGGDAVQQDEGSAGQRAVCATRIPDPDVKRYSGGNPNHGSTRAGPGVIADRLDHFRLQVTVSGFGDLDSGKIRLGRYLVNG